MNFTFTENLDIPDNVIVLHEVISKHKRDACRHTQVEIDRELNVVKCRKCNAELNPIELLARFSNEQSLWFQRAQEYKKNYLQWQEADKILEKKHRCKCEHCGNMTKIYRNVMSVVK